jgi:CelD/BcsL family acetyltransferase involved in cellulose biosynthesis
LPQSFEGFLSTVGSNLRYNFRRRLRALEREGRLEFQTAREWPSILPAYNALTGLHGIRFRQKRESSDFLIDRVQSFHMDALHEMAAGGMAWVNLLKVNEKPVAALYGFSTGKRFSFYQSGMDPAWSRLSAGLVLLGLSIQEAIRTGHEEFDLLEGDQEYKRQWASHHRSIATQCFFDRRTKSRLAWAHVWTIRELKKIKARFR